MLAEHCQWFVDVCRLQHSTQQSVVQKPLNPAEGGGIVFEKESCTADSHPFMWSFGEAGHVAVRKAYDRLSFCPCKVGVMHLRITSFFFVFHGDGGMNDCVEILVLTGG